MKPSVKVVRMVVLVTMTDWSVLAKTMTFQIIENVNIASLGIIRMKKAAEMSQIAK